LADAPENNPNTKVETTKNKRLIVLIFIDFPGVLNLKANKNNENKSDSKVAVTQ
jgi:hypothetical protein